MSHLMRAQLGFCPKVTRHEPFDEGSARILCGSREPKLLRVASKSAGPTALSTPPFVRAGYGCRNNTTVLSRPEAAGWAPLVCAGPLTTSLRGLWVSGLLPPGNGGTNEGAATQKPTVRHKGAATQKPTSERRNSRSNLGSRERDPRTLASRRHWFSASCRGNCLRYSQADTLRDGMSLVVFRNWTIGQWYGLISSCPYCMWLRGYGYSFSWSSSTGSSCFTQAPLASSEVEGRWQWPSLVAILCTAQHVRTG